MGWRDYGYNIELGENFYANHNLVAFDCGKVTFGDNVFVAPDCGFHTVGQNVAVMKKCFPVLPRSLRKTACCPAVSDGRS